MHLLKQSLVALLFSAAELSAQATITAERIPNAIADGGGAGTTGTPYAVFVRIQGWTAGANSQAYLKLYFSTNNEYMWSATGAWSNTTTFSSSNQPVVSIDASGNWAGWIYAKHNTALGVSAAVRAAKVGSTSTQLTSGAKTFSILNMSAAGGNGGWIFRASSPAVNKGIVAYAGGAMVGTYRTEDNSVSEGYAYGAGGFKIAVPAGFVDSLVTFNDDGSRDQLFAGPWSIAAGGERDASQQGGTAGPGTAVVVPSMLAGAVPQAFSVRISGAPSVVLRAASVVIPHRWNWSRTTADVAVSGPGTPQASTSGDTVVVTGLAVGPSDTASVSFSNVTPYDTTAYVLIPVLTGPSGDSLAQIRTIPVVFVHSTPMSIATARENDANGVPLRNNTWVTVRGIVTVANEFGGASYIQDNSGGMTVYGTTFSSSVSRGDEVVVAGLIQPFNGLMEIVTPVLVATVSAGNTVDPVLVTAAQIAGDGVGGLEQFEGRLVRVNGVSVAGVSVWSAGTNYTLTDASGSTQLRIDKNTTLVGKPAPASVFDVVGVVGQFVGPPGPYIGGYQLMPRSPADIYSSGPVIATAPEETDIQPTSLTVSWKTVNPGTTRVRYGVTRSFELGIAGDDQQMLDHAVGLPGLTPATIYYIQAFSVSGVDTSIAQTLIASTASPAPTTGVVNVYFNKSIDSSVAWQQPASANQNLVSLLVQRIANARRSIDAALYSLSGTPGPGTDIANALIAAKNRGVRIRVIRENDNPSTSPFNALVSNGIPLITDTFDPVNAGAGLMHNKFFIIDGRGGAPESVWVWTGSWNPTDPGTNNDYQNVVEIQDQALAGAYLLEFNEMWGSDTDLPVVSASRFGPRKSDNTPHRFVIGGRNVECYFSPSDRTTSKILDVINGAHHSVAFALLTITRTDLSAALVAKKTAGMKVRGALDNNTDTGTQYATLVNGGVDVRLKSGAGSSGYLHHKYGVVDAEDPLWAPVTITGSHNWSSAAENSNNENTLILHDHSIANQFLQEFTARYYQYGGADTIRVGVQQEDGLPTAHRLYQNFPNPFNPETTVRFSIATSGWVSLRVYDILGREVETLLDRPMLPGTYAARFDAKARASGIYVVRLTVGSFVEVRKMVLVR